MATSSDARRRKKEKVLEAQRQVGAVPKKSVYVMISVFAVLFLVLAIFALTNLANH